MFKSRYTIAGLEARMDSQEQRLDRLVKALDGNGREGLIQTVTRIDEKVESISECLTDLDKVLDKLNETAEMMKDHMRDRELHTVKGLIGSVEAKKLLSVFVVLSLWIILLEMTIPPELTVWDLIAKLLGL